MSLNSLLIDSGSKGWADLFIDTIKVYNGATFQGTVNFENSFDIENINNGPNNTFLHTDNNGVVKWQTVNFSSGITGPTGPIGNDGSTGPTGPQGDQGGFGLDGLDAGWSIFRRSSKKKILKKYSIFRRYSEDTI